MAFGVRLVHSDKKKTIQADKKKTIQQTRRSLRLEGVLFFLGSSWAARTLGSRQILRTCVIHLDASARDKLSAYSPTDSKVRSHFHLPSFGHGWMLRNFVQTAQK